jgi:hypothetical protein
MEPNRISVVIRRLTFAFGSTKRRTGFLYQLSEIFVRPHKSARSATFAEGETVLAFATGFINSV